MQGTADGIVGKLDLGLTFELGLQERHRPIDGQIAELIGRDREQVSQASLDRGGLARRPTRTVVIVQASWVTVG